MTPPEQAPIIFADLPCSIQDDGAGPKVIQGRTITVKNITVYMPTSVPVINGDFILYGTRVFVVEAAVDVAQLQKLFVITCVEFMTQPL